MKYRKKKYNWMTLLLNLVERGYMTADEFDKVEWCNHDWVIGRINNKYRTCRKCHKQEIKEN